MKTRRRWIQYSILLFALLLGVYTIGSVIFKKDETVKVGLQAPDFNLIGIDGKEYNLSNYKGTNVVVNFWGTFCPPCVREMPALERQHEKWMGQNVKILGINLNESPVTIKSFLAQYDITFPALLDRDIIRKKYKVISYPTTFYINAEGKIVDIFVGEMTESDIERRISKLVSG